MFAMNRVNPTAEPRSSMRQEDAKKYYKEEKYRKSTRKRETEGTTEDNLTKAERNINIQNQGGIIRRT